MRLTPFRVLLLSVLAAAILFLGTLVYMLVNGVDRPQALAFSGGTAALAFLLTVISLLMAQESSHPK